ncbi:MAG: carbonic anhydrase [Dokdonella sp.]|jgi:carbonic anhydrase|uniref:carbonic anhydrase n=3 Tax=Dokdonella sp. TaxID=2291710 RepID=UPI001B47C2BE|nr:carbonic anhydrase [Dokdonella sp.]MCC6439820.1 carbonic anhydrase [Rhodanobacteraceae bacterium]MBK8123563.1 carbonic anhydrase [Dokdonella sp.]MBP6327109.1 carbonic anhydrase [Dokdonella sp.]MBP6329680.1 carbonic anhydrase [Dokdonella sp.]HNV07181.1 carbonic anhydrase [Dokdonella sp.]
MIPADEALERLRDGNRRFVAELGRNGELSSESRRRSLATRQQPFAIILGCSDSRVPAELIFDQGLGDLFVIRVAGNIVAPSQIDSVEFSAVLHRARLVVVLGHTQCGAILSTIEALNQPADDQARKLRSIVDRVRPSVEMLMETEVGKNRDELIRHSVRNNIRMSVNQLRRGSAALEHLIEHEGLRVVGAEYSLETGVVEFFNY